LDNCGASQSGLAPDCFTIGAQRWTSTRTKAANSAMLLPTGMAPSFCNCLRMPELVIAATIAALSLFVMSAGRWAGRVSAAKQWRAWFARRGGIARFPEALGKSRFVLGGSVESGR
jgi:hypothetical protein